jgi:iron complex outermembrane recepter protein
MIAGYSHNNVENLEGGRGDFYSEPGRVPGGQGPQDLVNFWATYRINTGSLENLGFGLGGNYAGEYLVADHSVVGQFNLPSYTVLNVSVFYNPDKFRLSLNVNNFTNEKYYIGYWSVNPQKPINFVISMGYKF